MATLGWKDLISNCNRETRVSHREPNNKSKLGGKLTAYHICLNKKTELYQTTTTTNHHERRRYIVLSTSTVATQISSGIMVPVP